MTSAVSRLVLGIVVLPFAVIADPRLPPRPDRPAGV
jgi:hypothetical protein